MGRESSFEMRTGYKETMNVVVSRVEEATIIILPTNLHDGKKGKTEWILVWWQRAPLYCTHTHSYIHISGESFQYIMYFVL